MVMTNEREPKPVIPPELRDIPLQPEHLERNPADPFTKVNVGHLDMDTIGAYCIARSTGLISVDAALAEKQRPATAELTDGYTLNLETTALPLPTVKELEPVRKQLLSLGLDTSSIDEAIAQARNRERTHVTPEQYNSSQGNITHTGEQKYTAAAQMWALTGRKPEITKFAQYLQMVEVTRQFAKKRSTRPLPTFAQLVDRILVANTPTKGQQRSPEQIRAILDESYALYQHAIAQQSEFSQGIDVSGSRFTTYETAIQSAITEQRALLEQLKFEGSLDTPAGVRVGLFDAREAGEKGAFGKINQLRDEHGRLVSEVTVLRGADLAEGQFEIKIAAHRSLTDKVDLQLLAKTLNAFEVVKGQITVHPGDDFGGHITIVGSPRESGTTFDAKTIQAVVCEYFEQVQPPDKVLMKFAEERGWNGAHVVYVEGIGDYRVPERAIRYFDTESTSLTPELHESGVYGDKIKLVRVSQIDFEHNQVLSDQALLDRYITDGQADKALRILGSLSPEEQKDIMDIPEYALSVWSAAVQQPRALGRLYCPLESNYFALRVDEMNLWMTSPEDKAAARFNRTDSPTRLFDTVILQEAKKQLSPSDFAQNLKQILATGAIREAFSQGKIYGGLLSEALALATDTTELSAQQNWSAEKIKAAHGPTEVMESMRTFIVQELSTAEIQYLIQFIEEKLYYLPPTDLEGANAAGAQFVERLRPLLEAIRQRPDIKAILEKPKSEEMLVEKLDDNHTRQVVILEVGRQFNMRDKVAKTVRQETKGEKQGWNVYINRGGVLNKQEELLKIKDRVVTEVEALQRAKPTAQIELYIQCPVSLSANIAHELGSLGLKIKFGQWINGAYTLLPTAALERAQMSQMNNPIEQILTVN